MASRKSLRAVLAITFLGSSLGAWAQRPVQPTLNEILQRLKENLSHYDKSVPSFFCDEHVVSRLESDLRDRNVVTDSTFRVKRISNPDHTTAFAESRDIKSINGQPPASQDQDMNGPLLLRGAFEGGLAVVSPGQTSCMTYQLQRTNRKRPTEPYVIRFATAFSHSAPDFCLLQEKSKGRALIDPQSMQIRRLEISTPRHVIVPGDAPVVGKRVLTVEYAPIQLGGETIWMPSDITMSAISGSRTFDQAVWSFKATYRGYHKLEVTSRIHSGSETPIP
jgi:hypothetical protein